MPKVKCPHCGSTNTTEIIFDKYNSSLSDPLMRCNDCGEGFGSAGFYPTRSEDKPGLIPAYISSIEFRVGGFFEGTNEVTFTAIDEGANVKVAHYPIDDNYPEKKFQITRRRWENLIYKLVDKLYVNEWREEYLNPDILDGTQWELIIKEGDIPIIECNGSNEYPPYWDELIQTLSYYSETELI